MNRKLLVSLLVALLVGSAFGQEGRYADPQGRYTAPVPAGWTVEATPDVASLTRPSSPDGVIHLLAPIGSEMDVVAAALAILVDPSLDAAFAAAPLQTAPVALPDAVWTQRLYVVGDDLVAAISLERGGHTVLLLVQATQPAYAQGVNAAVNEILLGLEVEIPEPEAIDPADLPYVLEEVAFDAAGATLAGVLSLPETLGPHPAVALVSGSGAQDRDGANPALPGYEPLRWLADHLTRAGFAVLRWDERGVGASTGDHANATSADLADDLEAAVRTLSARPDVDPERVGILGHSEGGALVAMVGARAPEVAFVIAMAPPTLPYTDVVVSQVERISADSGMTPEQVAEAVGQQRRVVELALAEDWAGLEAFLLEVTAAQVAALPAAQREQIGDVDAFVAQQAATGAAAFQVPWMRFFLTYDPADDWSRVTAPVLGLFAGLDAQVDLDENLPAFETALAAAGNDDVTVVVLPEANHLFQRAETGALDEYLRLEMAFLPALLEEITAWLAERFGP
ncbi:MAG: alpha/beta fold hydrolase [Trueperaceae bacterium]